MLKKARNCFQQPKDRNYKYKNKTIMLKVKETMIYMKVGQQKVQLESHHKLIISFLKNQSIDLINRV